MANDLKLATAGRNGGVDGVVDKIDIGSGQATGKVEIREGTPPVDPNAAATGTLLATLLFANPAFGAGTAGVATANAIAPDTSADATGTAGWFRVYDRDDNPVFQGTCGLDTGTFDMEFDDVSIVAGGTVSITSWTHTQPES